MDCDKFAEEKLEGADSPEFRAHRAGCAGCARDVEEVSDVRRLYREASEEERWRGGVPAVRRRPAAAWVPVAAAAAVIVALLAGLLNPPSKPPEGTANGTEPPPPFVRVHLAPWDREENRLARAMDDAWTRLERLEGSLR